MLCHNYEIVNCNCDIVCCSYELVYVVNTTYEKKISALISPLWASVGPQHHGVTFILKSCLATSQKL